MKIKPLKNIIYLKLNQVKAGALDISSRESAVEYAEVLAVGGEEEDRIKDLVYSQPILKKGDKVFVKSWAIDIITHEDEKYHFVNIESGGILAIVR